MIQESSLILWALGMSFLFKKLNKRDFLPKDNTKLIIGFLIYSLFGPLLLLFIVSGPIAYFLRKKKRIAYLFLQIYMPIQLVLSWALWSEWFRDADGNITNFQAYIPLILLIVSIYSVLAFCSYKISKKQKPSREA